MLCIYIDLTLLIFSKCILPSDFPLLQEGGGVGGCEGVRALYLCTSGSGARSNSIPEFTLHGNIFTWREEFSEINTRFIDIDITHQVNLY